jgi:hypothetical protein
VGIKKELGWCSRNFEFLIKIMNIVVNFNTTRYIAKCSVSTDNLCLVEGAALGWFTYNKMLALDNLLNEVGYVTSLAKNCIQNS